VHTFVEEIMAEPTPVGVQRSPEQIRMTSTDKGIGPDVSHPNVKKRRDEFIAARRAKRGENL
jgi:hypothetical protein